MGSKVREAQEALSAQGLFFGDVDGELDLATMKALGRFQEAHKLEVSGVPSPKTRRVLLAVAMPAEE